MNDGQKQPKINAVLAALAWAAAWTGAAAVEPPTPWSEEDCWAFLPGEDPHSGDELFSLRPLLDGVAGERGWIRHDENGDFVRGDGSPIRFWGTCENFMDGDRSPEAMEAHARHYAKRGLNMVRVGRPGGDRGLDKLHRAVAAFKKHGIYSVINIYWDSSAILFWDEDVQAAYKNNWREVLTTPNPHCPDRTPLGEDPSVAVLQIQNEASFLWWNMQGLAGGNRPVYDRLNARFKAWQAENGLSGDEDLDFLFWDINRADPAHAHVPRDSLKLTMRWSAETMRAFNEEIARFLRDDLGCPALVNAGNWQTADQVRLLDLERWSYDANEVIALNRYVDLTGHKNPHGNEGWLVERGDTFNNASLLRGGAWRDIPVNAKQVKGKPFLVTETGWVAPNLYQAEAPFLLAAYMSLTGVDSAFWSCIGSEGFDVSSWPWQNGVYKWGNHASPQVMGGWPAAAWMFHQGYLRRGEPAVDEKRAFEGDLWDLKVPVIAEDSGFDPNQPGTQRSRHSIVGGVPAAAFLIGPVRVEYGGDPALTAVNLGDNTPEDMARGVIRANTGEILMDTPRGVCVVDAPAAQGVAGFLAEAGRVETRDLAIDLRNEYAAVLAVSLDGRPLAESGKILLQTTTLSRPDGWKDEVSVRDPAPALDGDGNPLLDEAGNPVAKDPAPALRIVDTGGGGQNAGRNHWNVKNTHGTVTIRNPGLSRATRADIHFYAREAVPVTLRDGTLTLDLPPDALYIVLEN